jgi:acid stress-induced BolA-like protein IbaG/YrbA
VDLKEKVAAVLRKALQPQELVLDDDDGLGGYIVSEKFQGLDSLERQKLLDKLLRAPEAGLSKADLRQILVIAALTPEEQALHTAD